MSTTPPPPPPPRGEGGASGQEPPSGTAGQPSPADWSTGAQPETPQRNKAAVTALVLGLVAFPGPLVLGLIPMVNMLTVLTPIVAIVALVVGVIGIRRARRPDVAGGVGMGVAGIVLGVINLLLTAVVVAGAVIVLQQCDIDVQAGPEQMQRQMMDCMEELGVMDPEEAEQLEEQFEQGAPPDGDAP